VILDEPVGMRPASLQQGLGRIRPAMKPRNWARIIFCLLVLGTVPAAHGSEPSAPNADDWLPSFGFGFGMQSSSYDSSAEGTLGGTEQADSFRMNNGSDSSTTLASLFMLDLGLATPVLAESLWSVRFLAQTGVQFGLSNDYLLMNDPTSYNSIGENDASPYCPVDDPANPVLPPFPDNAGYPIRNVCDWDFKTSLALRANFTFSLGFDFTLPFGNRTMHIRPSVEYLGQYLDVSGSSERTDRIYISCQGIPGGDCEPTSNLPQSGSPYATYKLSGTETRWLSAIGPRLSLAFEMARVGPIGLDFVADGRLYWNVNSRPIQFSGTTASGSPGATGEANFSIRPDPLVVQLTVGLTMKWQGAL
jgi:hypothetical protein